MDTIPFVVLDATLDERFKHNKLVVGGPKIRFYAGVPLVTLDGYNIGTFCIIDTKPRHAFRVFEVSQLISFAHTTMAILEIRHQMKAGLGQQVTSQNTPTDKQGYLAHQEINKTKTEFVCTISHELRTPLTSIQGALDFMKSEGLYKSPEKVKQLFDIAYNNTERLQKLINEILDYSKLSAGKMSFQMQSMDLCAPLQESVVLNASYADQYGVTFTYLNTKEPLIIKGDFNRIMQVIANLLSNAAKFSKPSGQVDVFVTRHNGGLRVTVKDYGLGIPEAAQATIFDKFTQLDSSDQHQRGGSGLGLSIAKMIVEAHGGQINFTSGLSKGSTFYFDLPELLASGHATKTALISNIS